MQTSTRRSTRLLLLVAVAVVLSACGRDVPASAQLGTMIVDVADRVPMPTVSGTTIDGDALDIADLRGRVVVLNSWASWCPPCRQEIPAFVALAGVSDPQQVQVVGLDVSDDPASAAAFVEELGMPYPSIVDVESSILATIPDIPPASLPSTVIVDRQGRIAATIVGIASPVQLGELVADVAQEAVSPPG